MSLTYQQAKQLLIEIKPIVEGLVCKEVIALSMRKFVLRLKKSKGGELGLLLCLQDPFLRFHLAKEDFVSQCIPDVTQNLAHSKCQILSHVRYKSFFASKLSNTLKGSCLIKCSLLNEDRILSLLFTKGLLHYQLIAELFPKRPNCYLLDQEMHILEALNPIAEKTYHLPAKPERSMVPLSDENVQSDLSSASLARHYALLESEADFFQKKRLLEAHVANLHKRAQRIFKERKKALDLCQEWQKIHHLGVLLQANLYRVQKGMDAISVSDWDQESKEIVIALEPNVLPKDQVAKFFQRSKKLRLGESHAKRQLHIAEEELKTRSLQIEELQKLASIEELERFCEMHHLSYAKSSAPPLMKALEAKPYNVYLTDSGLEIWVGKNAKANDEMTFRFAKGSDWWLHVRDYPGSHVILRAIKNKELDQESLLDAAELALRFSKGKDKGSAEVCVSQVKYLSRIKSALGKVQLSTHKVIHINLNDERWNRLRERRKQKHDQ